MQLRPALAELVHPRRAALVVVDVQNDFCDPNFSPGAASMLPRLKAFIEEARRAGLRVIFTKAVHSEKTDTPVWLSRYALRPERINTCREGSPGAELHPDFRPLPGDVVIEKPRYSAFIGTNFEVVLHALKVETLIFTGIATDVCVESTLRDAFQRDYWTVLVSDCTATTSEARHVASLEIVARNFGIVAESTEIVRAWQRVGAAARGGILK